MTINILVYRINDLIFFCVFRLKFSQTAIMTIVNVLMQVLDRAYSRTVFNIHVTIVLYAQSTIVWNHPAVVQLMSLPMHKLYNRSSLQTAPAKDVDESDDG